MDIEKIKNYNQKVLAVLCTLGVVFLLICTIIVLIEAWPHGGYEVSPQGLIADEETEALNQENLRRQIVSYETPWLIDTLQSIYIVPVSIKTLKRPEEATTTGDGVLNLMDISSSRFKKGGGYYNHKRFEGKYANLIVYDGVNGNTKSLFDERVIIGNVQTYYFKDDILLVFYVATKDTDKNGVIDLNDLRSLNLYSFQNGTMRRISEGNNQVADYRFMENTKDLLIELQLGQYQDNQFTYSSSPQKIMKYDYNSQQLTNIIPDKIQDEMQKLVEGK